MEASKERAARRNRATPARTSDSLPAHGSRPESIAQGRQPAKYQSKRIATVYVTILLILTAMASTAVLMACNGQTGPVGIDPGPVAVVPPVAVSGPPAADSTPPEQTAPPVRYELTAEERDTVERVVMAEAGGECYEGQVLVAQCILNAAEKLGQQPSEAVVTLRYAKGRPEPTQSVRDAVAAVFDRGETITDEPILYFYAPARTTSEWHESQIFVIEVGGHRFFAERSPS